MEHGLSGLAFLDESNQNVTIVINKDDTIRAKRAIKWVTDVLFLPPPWGWREEASLGRVKGGRMRNAEAQVCRAAGPRREAPWGAGGWRSVRCDLRGREWVAVNFSGCLGKS